MNNRLIILAASLAASSAWAGHATGQSLPPSAEPKGEADQAEYGSRIPRPNLESAEPQVLGNQIICEAPSGRFERYEIGGLAQPDILRGRIRLLGRQDDAGWPSAGGLVFAFAEGGSAGAFVIASPQAPRHLLVMLKPPGDNAGDVVTRVPRGRAVEVSVSLDAQGILTVRSGRASRQIHVGDRRPIRREAHCQSGRVQIDLSRD